MPSKVRQFADLAKQVDSIVDAIEFDSARITSITQQSGIDSAAITAMIDSDYLSTRQNFNFNSVTGKPTTLSGYGITNAKTSTQQDSDITATVNTLKDGAPTELDDLNKIAAAINDDANFFDTVQTYTLVNAPLSVIQGSNYGYVFGGITSANAARGFTDRFPFAAENSNTGPYFHSHLKRGYSASSASPTNYYIVGGYTDPASATPSVSYPSSGGGGASAPGYSFWNQIMKADFSSGGNASDIGDLIATVGYLGSHQSSSHGYASGGYSVVTAPPGSGTANSYHNRIQKYSFSSDGNSTTTGFLVDSEKRGHAGHSTPHCGYTSGSANSPGGHTDTIERFPFAADTNSTDIANLSLSRNSHAGNSSDTHGYVSGGATIEPAPSYASVTYATTIEKFSFSSNSNSTSVGDLAGTQDNYSCGVNSTTNGYTIGLVAANPPVINQSIQKFSFASDGDAVADGIQHQFRKGQTGWQT